MVVRLKLSLLKLATYTVSISTALMFAEAMRRLVAMRQYKALSRGSPTGDSEVQFPLGAQGKGTGDPVPFPHSSFANSILIC